MISVVPKYQKYIFRRFKKFKTLYLVDCNNISDISSLLSLRDLEHFTKLNLHRNNILDISTLATLTKLKWLNLSWNNVSDISPLGKLTNLKWLNLELNNTANVSPLAVLTNLEWLNLTKNPITDFSPLEVLSQNTNILTGEVAIPDPNLRAAIAEALSKDVDDAFVSITLEDMATLTTLKASNRDIKDLTGIEFAMKLETLELGSNSITNISPIKNLTALRRLHLQHNPITDFSPLAAFHSLIHLEIKTSDLSPLSSLHNLETLFIHGGTGISDLSSLSSLHNLEYLYLGHQLIADLSPLKDLTALEHLDLWLNRVVDLSPLTALQNLKYLRLSSNQISDLSPLTSLHNLKRINARDNKVSGLSPLAALQNLEELSLPDNEISDVSPLASLHNLKHLDLRDNKIQDVSSLASLHNLEKLMLQNNLISDFSSVEGLPALISLLRSGNPGAPSAGPKIGGPWLWVIVPGTRLDNTTDFLAEASSGKATEVKVATNGAKEGKAVGDSKWTSHTISPVGANNINEMTAELSWGTGREIYDHILYGSIILYSPLEQNTHMFIGSDDGVKVWLNGALVYQDFSGAISHGGGDNYRDYFPVTLKQGANFLLVAVDNRGHANFSGFWGFAQGIDYTLIPFGVGFTFSSTETALLAGDTFTLNLNAENITDLVGWQANIAYDHNVLEAVEVTEGDFLKAEGGDTFFQGGTIDNVTGKITGLFSARISESGVSGTGTLLSVTFKAKAGGKTQVTLENFEFSSISGAIIPSVPPNITITVGEYPAWDVNQDGRVSVVDLVLVAKDLGSDAPANLRTDVNRDGVINIQDLILVAQHLGESTVPLLPLPLSL